MKNLFLITQVIILLSANALSQLKQKGGEESAVRQVVEHYLHGLKFNDVASLKKAFWQDAKLMWVKKDGQLGQLTQELWYKSFVQSAGQEEKGELRITAVDFIDNIASVKVEEFYPTSKYIDYLSLLRINGEWKIVNKIYVAQQVKK